MLGFAYHWIHSISRGFVFFSNPNFQNEVLDISKHTKKQIENLCYIQWWWQFCAPANNRRWQWQILCTDEDQELHFSPWPSCQESHDDVCLAFGSTALTLRRCRHRITSMNGLTRLQLLWSWFFSGNQTFFSSPPPAPVTWLNNSHEIK